MTYAVIPAAGKSTRMGRPKLALPVGDKTVLEGVVAALRQAGVERIVVVIGPHVPELVPLAERSGALAHVLAEETPDMRATVEHGLRWLEERFHPTPEDRWFLVPADHPALDAEVVGALLRAGESETDPRHSLFIPTHQGRRGHPTLLTWAHVGAIYQFPPGQGLNLYLRQHAGEIREVPVPQAHVLADLDTPEEYATLLNISNRR